MASGSIYDEDGEKDDNLGPNREEEEETLAEGVTRSQQNLCLNSGDEFKMQAGEDIVPLNSPEQEAEQILKKCAPEARGDHWIALRDQRPSNTETCLPWMIPSWDLPTWSSIGLKQIAVSLSRYRHTESHQLGYQSSRKKLEKC